MSYKEVIYMHNLSFSSLTLKYISALALIGFLSVISFFNMNQLIYNEQKAAELINLNGRQRMLSQKMALYSLELIQETDGNKRIWLRKQLSDATISMENAQTRLNGEEFSGFVQASLEDKEKIDTYIKNGNEVVALSEPAFSDEMKKKVREMIEKSNEVLLSIDNTVNQQQKESEARIAKMLYLQGISMSLTFFVLLIEAIFLFRPMIKTIRSETDQLVELNQTLEKLSSLDGLTGLANRRYFDNFLNHEWLRGIRECTGMSAIIIDIDHFKLFNDTYGHQGGDDCLKKVATTLQKTVKRSTDLVARYGGEEFVVVLPKTDKNGAIRIAEKIREEVEKLRIEHAASSTSSWVTVSIGVASSNICHDGWKENLLAAADEALYQAKNSGRNQVKVAETVGFLKGSETNKET